MNKNKYINLISKKGTDIFMAGRRCERESIVSYLLKCADELNFGKSTPNEVIIHLMKIVNEDKL